jgi:hypothetical protein
VRKRLPLIGATLVALALAAGLARGSQALAGSGSTVTKVSTTAETVTPTDDSTVSSAYPSTTAGRSTSLTADASPIRRGYIRFDLSGIQGTIVKAVLELTPTAANTPGFTVHNVADSNWTESTLTYNNAPAMDATSFASSGPLRAGVPVDFDVTSLVASGGVHTVALADNGSSWAAGLASSESTTLAGPKLLLTVNRGTAMPPLAFPLRTTFYYPWFPETWGTPTHSVYHPTAGLYSTDDTSVVDSQIKAMDYAHINVAVASWWGVGTHKEQTRIPMLLDETSSVGSNLRWSLYYEKEAGSDPSASQIASDLDYIKTHYASNPWYAKINGKPVIFVYAGGNDGCGMADRWSQANAAEGFYVVLKVFRGYQTCSSQPDSWHQYSPAVATDQQRGFSYGISPGFWKWDESSARLARDPARFKSNVMSMATSGEPWQIVTTFNEWGEGTAVESASEWASSSGFGTYLDALHDVLTGGASLSDPVVAAAGDIACSPSSAQFNGGDGTTGNCRQKWTSDLLVNMENLQGVMPLGDVQYECGNQADFDGSYDPSWGRLKSITHWVTGNHEYGRACGRDDNSYATDYFSVANPRGYYSWDVGKWHMIALNSECSYGTGGTAVGGCGAGSPQETWLQQDLASHSNACTLAYWHEPRFSSGEHGDAQAMATIWNDLVNAHVDIVLSGHNHDYERFEPIGVTPQSTSKYQDPVLDPNGIREFVVGTGGKNHYGFGTQPPLAGQVVRNSDTYGVLKLTLHPSSYDWSFVNDPGSGSFTDSGSGACH